MIWVRLCRCGRCLRSTLRSRSRSIWWARLWAGQGQRFFRPCCPGSLVRAFSTSCVTQQFQRCVVSLRSQATVSSIHSIRLQIPQQELEQLYTMDFLQFTSLNID